MLNEKEPKTLEFQYFLEKNNEIFCFFGPLPNFVKVRIFRRRTPHIEWANIEKHLIIKNTLQHLWFTQNYFDK